MMLKGVLMMAWLSIMGMYNYDPEVFSGFRTPENVDRATTINNILLECAELELIYSNWETMQFAIQAWTNKEFSVWDELQKTREYDYNPIWNKDGKIIETEESVFDKDRSGNYSGSGSGTTTKSVKGFNSDTWAEAEKETGSNSASAEESETITDTGNITRERLEQGNIGVTTTQRMIQEQRDIVQFNTMQYIIDSFKKRFCLLVY